MHVLQNREVSCLQPLVERIVEVQDVGCLEVPGVGSGLRGGREGGREGEICIIRKKEQRRKVKRGREGGREGRTRSLMSLSWWMG